MKKKILIVFPTLFVLLTVVFYLLYQAAPLYKFSVLITGNIIMALLSAGTCYLVAGSIQKKAQAFVRGVYGATFLKLIICIGAILAYALLNRDNLHKPTLFILFGIYAVYTAAETILLSRMARLNG